MRTRMLVHEFDAIAFDAEHAGGQRVRLRLGERALEARTEAGPLTAIPYAECRLERGGVNGKMWFCRPEAGDLTLMCGDPAFASALRERAPRELAATLDALAGAERAQTRRLLGGFAIALVVLVVAVVGGYAGIRAAGRASVRALPASIDETLGEQAFAGMKLEGPKLTDTPAVSAVRTIVDRLAAHAEPGFDYDVHVVDAPVVNAFALPGGTIVVYTGLLAAADSPEQVAGVIAHEMAHVTRRHGMQRITQSVGVIAAFQLLLGDVSGLAGLAVHVLREGAVNSYSREQEHEADLVGVQTMSRARLDPRALAAFLAVLKQREQSNLRMPAWLSTHPVLDRRIAEIEAEAARLPKAAHEPFALNWREVRPKSN